jgi:CRP-like cAMP-binding protein
MEIESLRAIPFLMNLSDGELNTFAALLETRAYKKGERILEEDAMPTSFHIVVDGTVHVRRRGADSRELLLARLGPGSFFGEINLFDPGLATASIYAMKDTHLAMISYDRFRVFMDENPRAGYQIASAILKEVARRMRTTDERLANSVFRAEPPDNETKA